MQGPPQLSEHDTQALCFQPSLCVRAWNCVCEAAGGGKAAIQGTAMAGGTCSSVTILMRRSGDMGASGASQIKIHCIH